jgi:hypothetical protein
MPANCQWLAKREKRESAGLIQVAGKGRAARETSLAFAVGAWVFPVTTVPSIQGAVYLRSQHLSLQIGQIPLSGENGNRTIF